MKLLARCLRRCAQLLRLMADALDPPAKWKQHSWEGEWTFKPSHTAYKRSNGV